MRDHRSGLYLGARYRATLHFLSWMALDDEDQGLSWLPILSNMSTMKRAFHSLVAIVTVFLLVEISKAAGDESHEIRLYREKAEKGDVLAMYKLASCFLLGEPPVTASRV